jgi:glycosyltransferase involved in cell wall biosynthesis
LVHLAYLAEATVLLSWASRLKVELVHVHFGRNAATVAMLCRVLGGPPFSFTTHGPEEFDDPRGFCLSDKISRASLVVAISSFCRGQLYRWAKPEDWCKIQLIRCGVDADFLRGAVPPPPPDRRLVCVGRLSEQKGHLLLIEAAARLARRGEDFEILLVGDGPLRPVVQAAIANHDLADHVKILGWCDQRAVRRALIESRAMVLPSLAEGLPVAVMESLALERPVVTTFIGGVPELVEPGLMGWLVPSGSIEALEAAMSAALAAPPEQLAAMGEAGARKVRALHDADCEAVRLLRLLEGLAGARR